MRSLLPERGTRLEITAQAESVGVTLELQAPVIVNDGNRAPVPEAFAGKARHG